MNAGTVRRVADPKIHFVSPNRSQPILRRQLACTSDHDDGPVLVYHFLS